MIVGMTSSQLSGSISKNFIIQMIPHHQAAIAMSRNLLQYSTCVPLQNIAENIITSQTKSIADMRAVLEACSDVLNRKWDVEQYQERVNRILQTMVAGMGDACPCNSVDTSFLYEMIPHHEGAIRMSENALCYPICPDLVPILQAIITSQKEGVREMQHLLVTARC